MLGAAAVAAILIILLFVTTGRDQGTLTKEEDEHRTVRAAAQNRNRLLRQQEEQWLSRTAELKTIRDEVMAGPCVLKALSWTSDLINEKDFKEIHLTKIVSRKRATPLPKRRWETKPEEDESDRRRGRKRTVEAVAVIG